MEKITSAAELRNAIRLLEQQRSHQEISLQDHWNEVTESIRPVNIIKRTFQDILPSDSSKSSLLGSALGLGTGFLTKKLFFGKSPGFMKKLLGSALQWGITALVAKNADKIKSGGTSLFRKIVPGKNGERVI